MQDRLDRFFSRAQGALVLLVLAATPLVFAAAPYEQFVRPKMVWAHSLAILLLILAAWRALAGRRVHVPVHGVNFLIALYFLWNLLMWPLATSRSLAAEQVEWLFIVLVVSWMWQEWTDARLGRVIGLAWCLSLTAGMTAVWALGQDLLSKWDAHAPAWVPHVSQEANRLGDWRGFVTAGFGNTDHIAAFLAMTYLPVMLLMLNVRRRAHAALLLIILLLCSAALIVCWSVGNNASLILASLVLVLGMGHARRRALWRKRKRRLFVWAGGCAAIICWLVTNTPLNPHRPGIFSEAFSSKMWVIGGVTRSVIWLDTLEMIRQHQVTGVGPGCFTYVFPSMRSQFVPDDPEWLRFQGAYTNAAHNGLLQVWAELGPVGAFLMVAMVVAAFRALGRAARAGGTRPAGWAAWGGIGALVALCGTSVMTFPLQLPVPTLLFFVLLPMGEVLSRAAHRPNRFTMPALAIQGRYGETVVYMEEMNRVTGVAGSFDLPRAVAAIAFVVWLAVCGQWMFSSWKPLVADIVYNRAHTARLMGDRQSADVLYRRALAIWPRHHDCRSEYSEFLLETGRYKECIDHLAIVFKRLDARELYWRRATAYDALGQKAEARRDFAIFRSRMPSISAKSNSDGISVP